MSWVMLRSLALVVALILLASVSFAGDAAADEPRHEADVADQEVRQAGHHEHRHHLGVFVGTTHAEGEDDFTVGADYEYRLATVRFLGVGGIVDHAGGSADSTVAAAATFVHFGKRLRLLVAPGIEHGHGHNEFLVRAGLAYQFRLRRLSLSPEFNVDFVDGEEVTVYGVSVGWGF